MLDGGALNSQEVWGIHVGVTAKGARAWPDEIKEMAVRKVAEGAMASAVAEEFGITAGLFYKWLRAAREHGSSVDFVELLPPAKAPEKTVEKQPVSHACVIRLCQTELTVPSGFFARRVDRDLARDEGGPLMIPSNSFRIYLATKPIDFRKGMDGLVAYVTNSFDLDPYDGAIWLFRSRRADRLKLIVWDGSGLVLIVKRLNGKPFVWPKAQGTPVTPTEVQFEALFAGNDWRQLPATSTRKPVFV